MPEVTLGLLAWILAAPIAAVVIARVIGAVELSPIFLVVAVILFPPPLECAEGHKSEAKVERIATVGA